MKPQTRCKRISVETWVAPGGGTVEPWGRQTREMEGRCVRPAGHEEFDPKHIYGDWLERGRG
jgi:hypothetical protein